MAAVLSCLFGCSGHCSSLLSACMEGHRETKVNVGTKVPNVFGSYC